MKKVMSPVHAWMASLGTHVISVSSHYMLNVAVWYQLVSTRSDQDLCCYLGLNNMYFNMHLANNHYNYVKAIIMLSVAILLLETPLKLKRHHVGWRCVCRRQPMTKSTIYINNSINFMLAVDEDPCAENPCANNGSCSEEGSTSFCNCLDGFTGDNCETGEMKYNIKK